MNKDFRNKRNAWRGLLSALLLCAVSMASAQELTVKSFTIAPTDISASQYPRNDLNGHPCGLVKVQLAVAGAQFEGNVIQPVENKTGEYWVYLTEGSKELVVKTPSTLPLHITFSDYQINGIVPKTTYVLTLVVPNVQQTSDDGKQYLMMQVEPMSSQVFVDGVQQELVNGEMSVRLPKGTHRYRVEAFGYETKEGEVTLGAQKGEPLKVTLQSKMAKVTISCATTGAQIYVNDQLRGASPWQGQLAAGSYVVESRLTGYHAQRQDISLSWHESRDIVIPELVAIIGNLNVDYKPLGAEIWIDGRKAGASPDMLRDIPIGSHNIEIRKDGYQTKKETVMISEGQTATISGVLEAVVQTLRQQEDNNEATRKAEMESAQRDNDIGNDYYYGRNGKTKDYAEAVKWYQKAAAQGNAKAQSNLGWMYRKGYGVTKDDAEAFKWYRKAAEQGNAKAQNNVGYMYKNGEGVTKDYAEAFKWYRKAAEQGDADAQNNLGVMYEFALGVTQDLSQAKYWYGKATAQGNQIAKDNLKRLNGN